MTKVWVIVQGDTFGNSSPSMAFTTQAAADEFARNAWGTTVSEVDLLEEVPDYGRDIKHVRWERSPT